MQHAFLALKNIFKLDIDGNFHNLIKHIENNILSNDALKYFY